MADLLTQLRITACSCSIPKSVKRNFNHWISHVVEASALYSASEELLDTVVCFFDFHETREDPKNTQYPVTDFLESEQDAQSESEKAYNWVDESRRNKIPCPGDLFRVQQIKALRWLHVDVLLQISVKKGIVDVQLM